MKILSENNIDRTEWSSLAQSSSTGTWFQTPEAYDFFASMPELFRPFVVAIAKDSSLCEAQHSSTPSLQTLRAVCVGYVTVEKNPIKQFFTRRAIIIGGPCLADNEVLESESFAKRGFVLPEKAKQLYKRHLNGEINISKIYGNG